MPCPTPRSTPMRLPAPAEARLIFLAGSRPLEKDGVNAERILTPYRRVKFDPSSVV